MPVLFLAVASFLVFLTVVALLWIAGTLESRAIRSKRDPVPARPFPLLSIADAFDPIYSVLWEAPIAVLQLIAHAGAFGIPVANLQAIYERAAARFPEIYDGSSFVQWLRFLEEMRLISWHGYKVALTPDGHAFLRFRFVSDSLVT